MDDITLLRHTFLDDDPAPDPSTARRTLQHAIDTETTPRTRTHRRRHWVLAGTGLAAATIAAAVALGLTTTPNPAPAPTTAQTAQEFLLAAATRAAAAPTTTTGKYWHTRWDLTYPDGKTPPPSGQDWPTNEAVTEQWQAATPGDKSWTSFVRVDNGDYRPDVHPSDHIGYGWEAEFSPAEVKALPTDPTALRQAITKKHDDNAADLIRLDEYLFSATIGLLARAPETPAQLAAGYQMLATLPGVHLDGTATDSTGRTGALLRYQGLSGDNQVIVDQQSYQVLARITTQGPAKTQIAFYAGQWTDTEPPHN